MTILVTGGAGFIGSNFVIDWLDQHDETVINGEEAVEVADCLRRTTWVRLAKTTITLPRPFCAWLLSETPSRPLKIISLILRLLTESTLQHKAY
jgi:hypothetical protein